MSSGLPKLAFVAVLVLNCILWSQSRYAHVGTRSSLLGSSYTKRSLSNDLSPFHTAASEECYPLSIPHEEQCTHVKDVCDMERTFLNIGYLESYFCAEIPARPFIFAGYALWLGFLFSTLGISASDFFCPNLGTIAHLLGLDENVAGVTFLAFGNGSPDMFATFSAMRSNSGGLAIGELLGAAAFITSCVVGSMCIIKPFKVIREQFLRDVGFFTVAVVLLLVILWDNKLQAWESAAMVMLYAVYVTTVVVGSWWRKRQERRKKYEALMRSEYADEDPYHDEQPYFDEPAPPSPIRDTLQVPSPFTRPRAISHPDPPRLGIQTDLPQRPRTRSSSPSSTPPLSHMPSFSLVGALEFRRVVSSLQRDAAASSLSHFESPLTPYSYRRSRHGTASGSRTPRSRTPLRTPIALHDGDPWDAALGVPLNECSPPAIVAPQLHEPSRGISDLSPIPSIAHTPASPTATDTDTDSESQTYVAPTRRERAVEVVGHVGRILFPTLHNFWSKSFLGKVAALLAAPAVMALTLTLPVVVTQYEDPSASEKRHAHAHAHSAGASESRLVDFEEEGVERALIAEEEVEEEMHELQFNKWLMAVQCCLGPLFCAVVLLDGVKHEGPLVLATGVAGFTAAIIVSVFADTGHSRPAQLARCAMGFFVAVVWIMAIADEVVKVLQTFGFIFGLSDAIIGITIFAIGNSLADLVANMSVAVFAPIMGFSACFGGPMLNILLGVGISGSYIVRQTGVPYPLHFSPTLVITGTGLLAILLATLVFVPLNGYFLPRGWGVALLCAYLCLMVANIVVEVTSS
ncbi:Sodium/calcium exchanger protein-domain-containing protein [Earliella scabrosa]|nr:Sodium/calcium exchanger protein-domain-containing protein [Earliella scabrosa]